MLMDELFGARDGGRFGVLLLDNELIANQRKVLSEYGKQAEHGVILFGGQNIGVKIGLLQLLQVNLEPPVKQLPGDTFKLFLGWFFGPDLPGLQKTNQFISQANWNGGFAEARKADGGLRGLTLTLGYSSLPLTTTLPSPPISAVTTPTHYL